MAGDRDLEATHEAWLRAIEDEGMNLTPREEEFVADLRDRFDRGRTRLSDAQADWLEAIYAKRTP